MACRGLVGGGEGVEVHEVSVSGDDTERRWNFFGALSLVRGLVGAVDDVKAYHDQQNVRRGRRAQQGRQNVRRMWPSVVGG